MTARPASVETAAGLSPGKRTLSSLKKAAAGCHACPLWKRGTQTVFGEGPRGAKLFLVGEQPGDREDLEGRPFVGPAGRLLDACLERAGIDRSDVYVTNVVKHFKWEARGKRRIHQKPNSAEIAACRPWLEAEIAVVKPKVLICLGATAAQALLGRSFRVTQSRGRVFPFGARSAGFGDGASFLDPSRSGRPEEKARNRAFRPGSHSHRARRRRVRRTGWNLLPCF